MIELTPHERKVLRDRISMTLANLGQARIYWLTTSRRITARSVCTTRFFRLPADAVLVGLYEQGIGARAVLDDLLDVLAVQTSAHGASRRDNEVDPAPCPQDLEEAQLA